MGHHGDKPAAKIWFDDGLGLDAAGFARNFTEQLILYLVSGTVTEPIQNGLMVDMLDEDERGKTLHHHGVAAGLVFRPLAGFPTWLTPENGWRIGAVHHGRLQRPRPLAQVFLEPPPSGWRPARR